MTKDCYKRNTQQLEDLMTKAGIYSLTEFSRTSGVSQWQLSRLLHGLLPKMDIETLIKIALTLRLTLNELISLFAPQKASELVLREELINLASLQEEYYRLRQEIDEQRSKDREEWKQSSLAILESWLLQWPTVVAAVEKKPEMTAKKILPIVKPVEKLVQQWGVEAIGLVDEKVNYDPRIHQLMEGQPEAGELVTVRYVGYRQGEKILHRAKVSPVLEVAD